LLENIKLQNQNIHSLLHLYDRKADFLNHRLKNKLVYS
jgi:hypothetical protein